jgi:hypothetical protein
MFKTIISTGPGGKALTLSRVCNVGNLSLYTERVGRENERNQTYLTHNPREAPNT